jgi:asparagine synthase (glutamine-hydrolysing)
MCGIFGIIGTDKSGDFDAQREKYLECSKSLRHRGPDWNGIHIDNENKVVVAHERLSIIDVDNGAQPLVSTDENIILSVNGEIYNHKGLKDIVLHGSYDFKTKSDCEVIIPLYQKYWHPFVNMLDGVFAFFLYDKEQKDFFIARDPIGVNPLYYAENEIGELCVASEFKAIRLWDTNCEIKIFPPGHYMSKTREIIPYYTPVWETKRILDLDYQITEKEMCRKVRESLTNAVEKRLMTDVPFGVLLSGGLDSSLTTSITNKILKERENKGWGNSLHSFSIGLEGAPDLKYAREVADYLGTIHHELHFTIQEGKDALRDLIYKLETYDVTTVRASTPMYLMTRMIKATGIKMVLSGEGADEILGGYLYFHNAPSEEDFHMECMDRVKNLHYFDCLRANKSTMAWGVEVRVPFLDKSFLETAIPIRPDLKIRAREEGKPRVEKYILRKAFDKDMNPEGYQYLPDSVLWRQKEQFSDGVGYNWVDSLIKEAESSIEDHEMQDLEIDYPVNTPKTKEGLFYRRIYEELFPNCAKVSKYWVPNTDWEGVKADPSGRAQNVHDEHDETF